MLLVGVQVGAGQPGAELLHSVVQEEVGRPDQALEFDLLDGAELAGLDAAADDLLVAMLAAEVLVLAALLLGIDDAREVEVEAEETFTTLLLLLLTTEAVGAGFVEVLRPLEADVFAEVAGEETADETTAELLEALMAVELPELIGAEEVEALEGMLLLALVFTLAGDVAIVLPVPDNGFEVADAEEIAVPLEDAALDVLLTTGDEADTLEETLALPERAEEKEEGLELATDDELALVETPLLAGDDRPETVVAWLAALETETLRDALEVGCEADTALDDLREDEARDEAAEVALLEADPDGTTGFEDTPEDAALALDARLDTELAITELALVEPADPERVLLVL